MIEISRESLSEGSCSACNRGELSENGFGLEYPYSEITKIKFCGYNLNQVVRLCDICINELSERITQQLKAEILLLIQRTKQCACADDIGSVKGLLEQIDAKLSAD